MNALVGFVLGFCCAVPITVVAMMLIEEREAKWRDQGRIAD